MVRRRVATLSHQQLLQYARVGAQAELARLREQIAAIERAFPEFEHRQLQRQPGDSRQRAQTRTRRRRMSSAQRKAVSERMKKYWADRRKLRVKTRA